MNLQAVIFDMDGLLVDSEPKWDQARVDMAARLGKEWGPEDHKQVMGVSTEEWASYMRDKWALELSPQEVAEQIVDQMRAYYREQIPFRDHAIQAVDLAAEHYTVALASGSERSLIDIVVASPELVGKFEAVVSADQVERGKPHPDVYLAAATELGIAPEACVCLEDSTYGALSGMNAGMKVISVPDERFPVPQEVLSRVDRVLTSLAEFNLELLRSL